MFPKIFKVNVTFISCFIAHYFALYIYIFNEALFHEKSNWFLIWHRYIKVKRWRGKLNQYLIGIFWTMIFMRNKVVHVIMQYVQNKRIFHLICNLIPLKALIKMLRHHFLLSHTSRLSIILYRRRLFALSNI